MIGAGNLATNLAVALHNNGLQIVQIVNRTLDNAEKLAEKVNAKFTDDYDGINDKADLYIIAVSDDSICELLGKLNLRDKLVIHTAGSIDMEVLHAFSNKYGIFYPLQTFSKNEIISFENIPVCIEANTVEYETVLFQLGEKLSNNVHKVSSEQRKILHVAAVFASNFSSYLYLIADKILSDNNMSFDLLKPLIFRTAEKIQSQATENALTGPARRNDTAVLQAHLQLLENLPEYQQIYNLISNSIVKHFHQS